MKKEKKHHFLREYYAIILPVIAFITVYCINIGFELVIGFTKFMYSAGYSVGNIIKEVL